RSAELAVFEVEVVDDLGNGAYALVGQADAPYQRFQRATVSVVGVVTAHHVEAHLPFLPRRGGIGEAKTRFGIDEAPDEPGRSHAVYLHAGPRHPGLAAQFGIRLQHSRFLLAILLEARLDRSQSLLCLFTPAGFEEVDAANVFETARQLRVPVA